MGPLAGLRVLEVAAIGALPFAGLLLADLGADVVRIDRPTGGAGLGAGTVLDRGRRSIAVDLKSPAGVETVLRLAERADALLEGMRPGVAERLGIGPDACLSRNPRLVYGRLTGYGQEGPLARLPGHDINFLALSGVLHAIGPAGGPPVIPLNLLADFAGGGMLLALGVTAALLERDRSGTGQVIDAAMVDGVAVLATVFHAYAGSGWSERRGTNVLDGAAHFYNVYECADGGHVAVGAIEPEFYAALLRGLGLDGEDLPGQWDQAAWPRMRERFAEIVRTKTRDEWARVFEGGEACVTPVLSLREAQAHPHNVARATFAEVDGLRQPRAAPRFTRTPAAGPGPTRAPGADTDEVLLDYGFDERDIGALRASGAVS